MFFDMLTVETYDQERDVTYPAWTVNTDKILQISSNAVIEDKITRTTTENAEAVIIPIAGTADINTALHLSARKALKDGMVDLLKDDSDMELIFPEKDKKWILLSSEEKVQKLLPYYETRLMINEAITLNTDIKADGVKVKENRSATKDRYMCFAMFNYFGDKLINKLNMQDNEEEIDDNSWDFLSGDYSSIY